MTLFEFENYTRFDFEKHTRVLQKRTFHIPEVLPAFQIFINISLKNMIVILKCRSRNIIDIPSVV